MKNNNFNDTRVKEVLEYIKSLDFSTLDDGKLNITDTIWANLQTYLTKEDALFEAHRKYIDVQYMVYGSENIGVSNYQSCKTEIPYDNEKDIEFLTTDKFKDIEMHKGDYLVLYPQDAHRPSISVNNKAQEVRKLVVKIPVI